MAFHITYSLQSMCCMFMLYSTHLNAYKYRGYSCCVQSVGVCSALKRTYVCVYIYLNTYVNIQPVGVSSAINKLPCMNVDVCVCIHIYSTCGRVQCLENVSTRPLTHHLLLLHILELLLRWCIYTHHTHTRIRVKVSMCTCTQATRITTHHTQTHKSEA